jgi:hypothetical protein
LILTASLLLLPALPSAAVPADNSPGPDLPPVAKTPADTTGLSIHVPAKPAYVMHVGAREIAAWDVTITVTRGWHSITVTQRNAADPATQPGMTHVEKWETSVGVDSPLRLSLLTWGARPAVTAKITRSTDAPVSPPSDDPPTQQPPADQQPVPQPGPNEPAPSPPEVRKPPAGGPGKRVPPRSPAPGRR